ncbi:MAG TPA: cation:proton antiporter [Mycobacterium sp.]|nr:cation:proton antiporter [Mycobacterium sp.]
MGATFAYVLLDIAVIVLVARVFGAIARRLRQPAVVGEIIAGIALGPSLLGLLPGHLVTGLFPDEVQPFLNILAKLGLVLFMFIVGLELDVTLIRGRQGRVGAISLLSVSVPFALGALLTLGLHPLHGVVDGKHVPLPIFMLFIGVAMSMTALPVLARIISERGMTRTSVGVIALSAAAIVDIVAWTLLALVYALAKGNNPFAVVRIVGLSAVFVAVMFMVVRPLLNRIAAWHKRSGWVSPDILSVVLVGVLLSALLTERIGIHEIFGAFLFGAIMPREDTHEFRHEITERLGQVGVLLLLPIFFVIAGLGVDLRAFRDPRMLWQLLLILLVAIGGKFGGAFIGARVGRTSLQHSAAIAVLMNTRGLTELVILLIGKQAGVLDTEMFTMLVVMALVTTIMTGPLLRVVYPDQAVQRDIEAAAKADVAPDQAHRVLVIVDGMPNVTTGRMLALADAALANRRPGEILLSGFPEGDDHKALCEDVVREVRDSDAEVVVIGEDWARRHPATYGALEAVTVLVVPSECPAHWLSVGTEAALALSDDAVYARDDGGPDGACAVVVAMRAAARCGRSLAVIVADPHGATARMLRQAFEPLRARAIDVRVVSTGEVATIAGGVTAAARVLDRAGGSRIDLRDAVADVL